jgi:serine/threonine protein kinase
MRDPSSGPKDSVTEVAEESFIRERPIDIERGTVLAGRYQVEDVLGKGGSGIVLRVFDRVAQTVVALKVLKSELAYDAKWERRFSRELRVGRPIQHPNVCRIFDIGEADGHRFLTMELARGGSLRDELKRTRAIDRPLDERLADAKAVTGGLAALHSAGVVHRDFKPDNLLRMDDGRLVLSDFGLATEAANAPGATVMVGTPHYMSPEVLTGEPATNRSDVWALGVVLHEIFFGQRPERRSVSFDGSGKGPLRPSSSIERALLRLCEQCLADGPLDRPADARVVTQLLDSVRPSEATVGRRRSRRRRLAVLGAVACLTSVVALSSVIRWRRTSSRTGDEHNSSMIRLNPSPPFSDLGRTATTLAELPGRVHCFELTEPQTARIVWGEPRKADDIDLATGRRRASSLSAASYLTGCPHASPSGKTLLFSAQTPAGASGIYLSEPPNGQGKTLLTSGSDPVWLGTDDEFVYDVDTSHAAVFSRPTMTMALLSDPEFGSHHVLVDAAAARSGDAIATLLGNDRTEFAVAVYGGQHFDTLHTFSVTVGTRIRFASDGELLLTSYRLPGIAAGIVRVDWRQQKVLSAGYFPGFDIVGADLVGNDEILVIRQQSSDAWLDDGTRREQLTSDGQNSSAAMSEFGDLLLSKRDIEGNYAIWRTKRGGTTIKVTFGTRDIAPRFGPDGESWVYADYTTRSISTCTPQNECRVVRHDDMLPGSPTTSPDGRSIAYVTQIGAPKLTVVVARDGAVAIQPWDAYYQCPPLWSSATTLWDLEMSQGQYSWFERNTTTGRRTGLRLEAPRDAISSQMNCWPASLTGKFAARPRAHIESKEVSRIVRVGSPLK